MGILKHSDMGMEAKSGKWMSFLYMGTTKMELNFKGFGSVLNSGPQIKEGGVEKGFMEMMEGNGFNSMVMGLPRLLKGW